MIEKFSDFEGGKFIDKAGEFVFEITDAELLDSSKGTPMVKLTLTAEEGTTNVYHSLVEKARWSYNKLIAAAFNLTDEEKKTFQLDYQTIHNDLIGKKVIGVVKEDSYRKEIKAPNGEGIIVTSYEDRISYKVSEYKPVA